MEGNVAVTDHLMMQAEFPPQMVLFEGSNYTYFDLINWGKPLLLRNFPPKADTAVTLVVKKIIQTLAPSEKKLLALDAEALNFDELCEFLKEH